MPETEIESNVAALEKQAKKLLGENSNITFLNNADWLAKSSLVNYLRNITPYISVNQLLTHETYQRRLEKQLNLSLLEFLYSSLQAWDFLYLFENYNCRLQIGGQDQWRNILDGVDLIRKVKGEEVFALTSPLLETGGGRKMGKSERGTVWLDPQKTSPYEFYQYWVNSPDVYFERNLKLFTHLEPDEIAQIMKQHPKEIQHRLAFEVTKFIHGEEAAATEAQEVPIITFARPGLAGSQGQALIEILARSGLAASKSSARRLIKQGGVKFNQKIITDPEELITADDFNSQKTATLQVGKRKIVKLVLT
jgi:tyrosyl-tRNA synthetase